MRELPILFSGAMVRALLDGRKTQTRRVVKLPHNNPLGQWEPTTIGGENGGRTVDDKTVPLQGGIWHTRTGECLMSPYGQPSDRLYVKEAFRFPKSLDWCAPCVVALKALDAGYSAPWCPTQYEADGTRTNNWQGFETPTSEATPGKLRPGRHMPRWASRITLEVTGVRVERLQGISDTDCVREGISASECTASNGWKPAYRVLWNSLNAARGYGWDANPFVWVVEFRRVV
jgi:hypothetical protein